MNNDIVHVSDLIRVTSAEPLEDYKLRVAFSDGKVKIYDVKPLLNKPAYKALKNKVLFNAVKVEYGTIVWNDEIDLCPDVIYKEGI